MVLVFGSAVTASGALPTGIVAVTVIQPLARWAMPRAEDADAAAAIPGAASASPVVATAVSIAPRCVNLMMSCPLAYQRQARYRQPPAAKTVGSRPPAPAGAGARATGDEPEGQGGNRPGAGQQASVPLD